MKTNKILLMVCICIVCILSGCSGTADYILQNEDSSGAMMDDADAESVSTSASESDASPEDSDLSSDSETTEAEKSEKQQIYVYICGAVCNPGVYELEEGSRVFQLVEMAGGFSDNASEECVNLANPLEDGEMIRVLTIEEASQDSSGATEIAAGSSAVSASSTSAESDGKVNLNTATQEELMTLSGIGETKAARIIEYREKNGKFQSTDEITQVEGIGESTYEHIKDDITVR